MPREHLPNRRVRLAGSACDQSRPPARRLANSADPRLHVRARASRLPVRPARSILQPSASATLLNRRPKPAMPPPMRRGHRDRTLNSGGPKRAPSLDQFNKGQPPGRSELRVSVNAHPGPPVCSSWRNRRASGRARTTPQTAFTTCTGRTPRYGALVCHASRLGSPHPSAPGVVWPSSVAAEAGEGKSDGGDAGSQQGTSEHLDLSMMENRARPSLGVRADPNRAATARTRVRAARKARKGT